MEKEEIIDTIKQFACSLAEKELVDKYGKLPEQLMTKRGEYRSKYQDEFNKLYDRYEDRLIRSYASNCFMCRGLSSGTYPFPAPERAGGRAVRPHPHRHRNYHSNRQ